MKWIVVAVLVAANILQLFIIVKMSRQARGFADSMQRLVMAADAVRRQNETLKLALSGCQEGGIRYGR